MREGGEVGVEEEQGGRPAWMVRPGYYAEEIEVTIEGAKLRRWRGWLRMYEDFRRLGMDPLRACLTAELQAQCSSAIEEPPNVLHELAALQHVMRNPDP